MNVASNVTYSDCYIPHFVHVEMRVILVIVRCDPAHPYATWLLTRKHSQRIIVLVKEAGGKINISAFSGEHVTKCCIYITKSIVQLTRTA